MSRSGVNAPGSARDKRDEQLERAGYLLVVCIDRFVRNAAALVLRICRYAAKQAAARPQMGARPSVSRIRS